MRRIFPVSVFGRSATNSTRRGYAYAESRSRTNALISSAELVRRLVAVGEHDERLDDVAAQLVGRRDDRGLAHRRMLEARRLDLERADPVAGRDDHVVGAADVPVVAVLVLRPRRPSCGTTRRRTSPRLPRRSASSRADSAGSSARAGRSRRARPARRAARPRRGSARPSPASACPSSPRAPP